ncbi:MAG: hypothetical protein FJ293_14055 [Planctomycetes bacterium]|nr:hypothetical protein [Planctomycetota bacterium]
MRPSAKTNSSIALAITMSTFVGVLLSCSVTRPPTPASPEPAAARFPAVAPPLADVANAYVLAGQRALPVRKGEDVHGLHNLFQLSANVWSGSEPDGEAAFEELARLGVKTAISVDGKRPDAELAAKHGLRYVHVPIEYKGLTDEELLQLAKTFRECEPPFYLHCFHGRHRGPAAAAVGRLVLDGAAREQVIAEMRQWCGTASDYEGLFRDLVLKPMPTADASRDYVFDFPAQRSFGGFREAMVDAARRHDALKKLEKRDFAIDPAHPDIDALESAKQLADTFAISGTLAEIFDRPADFHGWMEVSKVETVALRDALQRLRGGDATALAPARRAYAAMTKACIDCHQQYRNH